MPMGESRAQVADRVKGVFGTILRDADPNRDDPVQNFIIVSHGVTIRAFILQWMHFNFEWYGRQTNPNNCSVNMITLTGEAPYEHRLIYPGFVHIRATAQDIPENGKLETSLCETKPTPPTHLLPFSHEYKPNLKPPTQTCRDLSRRPPQR